MRHVLLPLAVGFVTGCVDPTADTVEQSDIDDSELHSGPRRITVMSQNQYLGADLTPIVAAPDPLAFNQAVRDALDQIARNRFPARSLQLALQIAIAQPDVVGLQEVFDFRLNGANGAPPYRDHLADTLTALRFLGQRYVVAAQVQNMNLTIPVDFDGDLVPEAAVGVRDRDVILVREGLAATPVPFASLCARPSQDGGPGCNYQVVASAPTAVGPLAIERGFVGVDLSVGGRAYRIVNTHLEVPDIDPANPLSPAIQAAQAQELTAVLGASTPPDRTLLVLGDFNSASDDEIIVVGDFTIVPPYLQMIAAGFIDTWLSDPRARQSNTCCHAEDLRNATSQLVERIDLVFANTAPASVRADVLGDTPIEKLPSGLWPSDHGTVHARLRF